MLVRFFRVIRVSVCTVYPLCQSECQKSHRHTFTPGVFLPVGTVPARVSRVCPGSPRCLFTGTVYDQNCSTSSRLSVVVNLHVPACASCKGITVCELHLGA